MSGISMALNIARGALMAQQKGIDVAGHNIANVNTPGYTRQKVVLDAVGVPTANRIKLGYGVRVDRVTQCFDRFTTKSIQQETSVLSQFQSSKSILDTLQTNFNEGGDNGLSAVMEGFWNAWQDLANNPGGVSERSALLAKSRSLCERFQSTRDNLTGMEKEANDNIGIALGQVNGLTGRIADLNEQIVASEATGTSANDLRDERNSLIENLAQLVGITYVEDRHGSMLVLTQDGTSLVDGSRSWDLRQDEDKILWDNLPYDLSPRLSGGQIGAWLDMRDETLPQYAANLDELAGSLIYEVNRSHYQGFGKDGAAGRLFFAPNAGDDYAAGVPGATFAGAAATISLSGDVDGQLDHIAASGASGEPGNNENALAIQALQNGEIEIRKWTYQERGADISSRDQSGTMDGYYTVLVGDTGLLSEENNLSIDFHQTMIDQMNAVRDSISGVNLDEEMIDLIKYQHGYAAASRLVSTVDQMLQELLQMR
jgi:flagellar hook-associated protein 1